tara:strand:- start:2273 stop:2533 length:261 start_codon:yes stop_codon:yes gene_type:complete
MIDLKDIAYVKGLQADVRATFESDSGKEVMNFLEVSCGWYQSIFNPDSEGMTLINDGKRQVLATIKTLLTCSAADIVAMAKRKEGV